jgi:CHAT domain-containing protein
MAFLASGARNTVGTLWTIDDAITRQFCKRLHEQLRRGLPAAAALQQAQLSMLRSSDSSLREPKAWAGFVALGAAR